MKRNNLSIITTVTNATKTYKQLDEKGKALTIAYMMGRLSNSELSTGNNGDERKSA